MGGGQLSCRRYGEDLEEVWRRRGGPVRATGGYSGQTAPEKKVGGGGARNSIDDPKLKINGLGNKNEA